MQKSLISVHAFTVEVSVTEGKELEAKAELNGMQDDETLETYF
jgi:hypothetical protein